MELVAILRLLFFHLLSSHVSQVIANVLIINQGYCEFELFQLEDNQKLLLGTVFPRRTARFLGYLDAHFELHWRNETVRAWTPVSSSATQKMPALVKEHYDMSMPQPRDRVLFHPTVISETALGEECSSPAFRQPADIWMASLVLIAVMCVLVGSVFIGTVQPSKIELAGWCFVLALYYPISLLIVRRLSAEYDRHYTDLAGLSTWNPRQGYRHSGLHRGLPISSLFGGLPWDLKDTQLRDLVESFPILFSCICLYLLIKFLCNRRFGTSEDFQRPRALITLVAALCFVGFLHEAKLLLTLSIVLLNFLMSIGLNFAGLRVCIPMASWLFALACLLASVEGALTLEVVFKNLAGPAAGELGAFLDGFKGELGWHTIFNFIVLRMISWSCDFARHLGAPEEPGKATHASAADADNEQARVETHRDKSEYFSLVLYLSYIFYPPLYLSGPIITFNAYASYMRKPQEICTGKNLCFYALRWFANTVLLVAFGHFIYVYAIMANGPRNLWPRDASQVFDYLFSYGQDGEGMIWYSYWTLKMIWMKFLAIWRFSRLWALLDGVCPPENMNRCMSNNYTVRGFWRAWHRSFNRWLVRYIFVPLGGSHTSVLRRITSILLVFMFVVLWHEPSLLQSDWAMVRVLAWGLLMTLFMAPELIVEKFCRTPYIKGILLRHPLLTRHLTAAGGALCIEMLMLANLIGYAYGLDGANTLLETCRHLPMLLFLLAYTMWLFAGAQMMMFIRGRELCKVAAKNF